MYAKYSDELIEEIRTSNDIVEVVSEYVKLERKGKNYFGLCPFHREKTPSFSVEPGKQIFYCFGCGKGGNVFHFISLAEKISYYEAVKLLADRARIPLPESNDTREAEKVKLKKAVLDINMMAARYYSDILYSARGKHAAAYLKVRNISEQTARKFGLGYAGEEWDGLYKHLKAGGFDDKYILQSGLVIKSSMGRLFDRFRGRLMFPIFDVRGNVIGFGGRVLDNSLPKYMNSPETVVYNKRKNLYALNFAKNSGSKRLVVVEGYMDVISLYQSGIENVVATLGTALTENQGRLMKKYAEEIIISYDADTAGQAATLRGLDILSGIGCKVKVLTVPDGKDPDEYVRKNGADKFMKLVDNALPLVDYKLKRLEKEHDLSSTEGKIAFLNKAANVLAQIDNAMEREMYIEKLSREYGISEEAVMSEVLRKVKPSAPKVLKSVNAAAVEKMKENRESDIDDKIIHNERFILSLLSVDNSIYNILKEHISVDQFSSEENKKIAGIIYKNIEELKGFTPAELLSIVSEEDAGEFARILNEECHCDDNQKAILGKIKDIKILKLEKRQKHVLELLKNKNELSEGDVEKLKSELKDLTLKIKEMKDLSL